MAWGRLEDTFHDEPKFYRLADSLQIPFAQAAGHMACLWSWAHRHALDGDLRDYDVPDIARAAKWDGDPQLFVSVLAHDRVKLLDSRDGFYILHNFAKRAEARKASKKKAKQRVSPPQEKHVPGQSPGDDFSVPREKRREEREEKRESEEARARVIDTETRARPTKPMEPFVLAEFRMVAVQFNRPLPETNDVWDSKAAGKIYAKYPNSWKSIVAKYLADEFYGCYGWQLQPLAKNLDQIANRKAPQEAPIPGARAPLRDWSEMQQEREAKWQAELDEERAQLEAEKNAVR